MKPALHKKGLRHKNNWIKHLVAFFDKMEPALIKKGLRLYSLILEPLKYISKMKPALT